MEIDKTDSHIFTATTTTTRMNISLETGKLRDTHSEGKVNQPFLLRRAHRRSYESFAAGSLVKITKEPLRVFPM
jgi:hypothetical protein